MQWTCDNVVTHPRFEQSVGVLVALNCFALGFETNIACMNHGAVPDSWAPWVETMELFFCILFSTEIILRVSVHRLSFLTMEGWQWNLFDFTIVGFQVFEQVLYLSSWGNTSGK